MRIAAPTWSGVGRLVGTAAVGAVVIGLPVAVELTSSTPFDFIRNGAVLAHAYTVVISSPLRLTPHLEFTLDSGLVSLPEGSDTEQPRGGIVVEDAAMTLDLTGSGPEVAGGDVEAPYSKAIFASLQAGVVRIRRGTVTLKTPGRAAFQLTDVAATATGSRKGHYRLSGTGKLASQQFTFDASWSAGPTRTAGLKVPLKLDLNSAPLHVALDGTLTTGREPSFTGRSELRMASARSFLAWAGFGRLPRSSPSLVAVSGPLEASASRLAFAPAAIELDGNQAAGSISVSLFGPRSVIDGTIAFQDLDLTSYFDATGQPVSGSDGMRRFLNDIDADLRVSASRVRIPAINIGRAAATLTLSKGQLTADLAELDVEGGSGSGHLSVDLSRPVPIAETKLRLKGIDAGRVLAAPLNRNPLLGRTNVMFEGTAKGRSVLETVSAFAGKGQFELAEPGRLGLDLTALIYAARESPVVGWAAAGRGGTPLDTLSGRFHVVNGALTIETMQGRSGGSVVVGSGRLDVPGRLMDMSIATGPAPATEAPVTVKDVLSLSGSWDNPAIRLIATVDEAAAAKPAMRAATEGSPPGR